MSRCARESKADARRRTHSEANAQRRAREHRCGLVEKLAEGLHGARSMRGTERRQGDLQIALGNLDVAGGGEDLVQQRSAFLLGTQVVRPQKVEQIALRLICEHLDDVRQMLSLGGELDHGPLAQVPDLHARGEVATFIVELAQMLACSAQLFAELAISDLEAAP